MNPVVYALLCALPFTALSPVATSLGSRPANDAGYHGRVHFDIPDVPLEAFALTATEIVHARVLDSRPDFREGRLPSTAYDIEVLGAVKGSLRSRWTVHVPGARDGNRWFEAPESPVFAFGEEVVLFLWTEPDTGVTVVLGIHKGAYRVHVDKAGTRRVRGLHARAEALPQFLDRTAEAWARAEARDR